MTPRRVTAFRLDDELLEGLEHVRERDGIGIGEQVRRAVRAWLDTKNLGGAKKKTANRRVSTRRKA
jgi:hypothetical protein